MTTTDPAKSTQTTQKHRRKWRVASVVIHAMVWAYPLLLLMAWMLIDKQGERWWFATLLLFGPRWMLALPLLVLMPLTWFRRRWLLPIVLLAGGFLCLSILNFAIPWRTWNLPASRNAPVRLFTCNTHRQFMNGPDLSRAITAAHPDLVVLQEWTTKQVPVVFPDPGWHVLVEGEMLLASRQHIRRVYSVLPPQPALEGAVYSYEIDLPGGAIRLINLHLSSPHLVFRDAMLLRHGAAEEIANNCRVRKRESEIIANYAGTGSLPTLIAGDFNTPQDSETFRTSWTNFTDAFSVAGTGFGITYRVRWTATRIDHILFDNKWQCEKCWLGPDVGSPHLPVIADLERTPS